jgi:hypothetical protein
MKVSILNMRPTKPCTWIHLFGRDTQPCRLAGKGAILLGCSAVIKRPSAIGELQEAFKVV